MRVFRGLCFTEKNLNYQKIWLRLVAALTFVVARNFRPRQAHVDSGSGGSDHSTLRLSFLVFAPEKKPSSKDNSESDHSMADLDDFFAKKDRKKAKGKKFTTTDEIAKKLEETGKRLGKSKTKDKPLNPEVEEIQQTEVSISRFLHHELVTIRYSYSIVTRRHQTTKLTTHPCVPQAAAIFVRVNVIRTIAEIIY